MATAFRKQHYQQSLSSLSAIFFDLDNTLVETRKVDNQTCRKVQEKRTSNLKSLSPLPSFQSPQVVIRSRHFFLANKKILLLRNNATCVYRVFADRVLYTSRALSHDVYRPTYANSHRNTSQE